MHLCSLASFYKGSPVGLKRASAQVRKQLHPTWAATVLAAARDNTLDFTVTKVQGDHGAQLHFFSGHRLSAPALLRTSSLLRWSEKRHVTEARGPGLGAWTGSPSLLRFEHFFIHLFILCHSLKLSGYQQTSRWDDRAPDMLCIHCIAVRGCSVG